MDILMQAWTQPGPSRYDGEFYQYKYLTHSRFRTKSRIRRFISSVLEQRKQSTTPPPRRAASDPDNIKSRI
jgi:hypothetical protein